LGKIETVGVHIRRFLYAGLSRTATNQAADQEPALRELFLEFSVGTMQRLGKLLEQLDVKPTDEHCCLLHAVSVGMAVVTLAAGRADSERRSARALERMFRLLTNVAAH
jgi:hypothetical protein